MGGALASITCSMLDRFIAPLPKVWAVEFYGVESVVTTLMHRVAACRARVGDVAIAIVQDFGGLNPYMLRYFTKVLGSDLSRVKVSRAFRGPDVPALLKSVPRWVDTAVIRTPFLFSPQTPAEYSRLTPITASIKKLIDSGINVAVFNAVSKFGRYLPEGGNYHHHVLHAVIRLWDVDRRRFGAEIVKHVWRVPGVAVLPKAEVMREWGGLSQHLGLL